MTQVVLTWRVLCRVAAPLLLRADRFVFLHDRLRRCVNLTQRFLDFFTRDRSIDFETAAPRVLAKLMILHGGVEGAPQRFEPLRRYAWRGRDRAAHLLRTE